MHTTPIQITNDDVVFAKDIVKIGKGVDKSSFVTGTSTTNIFVYLLSLMWFYM